MTTETAAQNDQTATDQVPADNNTPTSSNNPLLDNSLSAMTKGGIYYDAFLKKGILQASSSENNEALRSSFAGRYARMKSGAATHFDYDAERKQVEPLFQYQSSNRQLVDAYTNTLIGAFHDKESEQKDLTLMQVGAVYYDVFLKNGIRSASSSENGTALRSAFAGQYVVLKKQKDAQRYIGKIKVRQQAEKLFQYQSSNRQLVDAYTDTLIGAVNDDKLPEIVVTEIERQKVAQQKIILGSDASSNSDTSLNKETQTARTWKKIRNVGAVAAILVAGSMPFLFKQNADGLKELKDGNNALRTQLKTSDSMQQAQMNAFQDHVGQAFNEQKEKMEADRKDIRRSIHNHAEEIKAGLKEMQENLTPVVADSFSVQKIQLNN